MKRCVLCLGMSEDVEGRATATTVRQTQKGGGRQQGEEEAREVGDPMMKGRGCQGNREP